MPQRLSQSVPEACVSLPALVKRSVFKLSSCSYTDCLMHDQTALDSEFMNSRLLSTMAVVTTKSPAAVSDADRTLSA